MEMLVKHNTYLVHFAAISYDYNFPFVDSGSKNANEPRRFVYARCTGYV